MKTLRRASFLFISCIFLTISLQAQSQPGCTPPATRAWIAVEDSNNHQDTVWFGYAYDATCNVDRHLCEFDFSWPCGKWWPFFCAYWDQELCTEWTEPLITHNYRKLVSAAQVDTFVLGFGAGEPLPGYPMKFSWDWRVRSLGDSLVIKDMFTGTFYNTRMDTMDTLIVTQPFINKLMIILYGHKIINNIESHANIPDRFELEQNYPNPFNPLTTFDFQLPITGYVTLKIYDLLGREIATLIDGRQDAGYKSITWDASTVAGGLSNGVYFYRLSTQNSVETKKMIYLE